MHYFLSSCSFSFCQFDPLALNHAACLTLFSFPFFESRNIHSLNCDVLISQACTLNVSLSSSDTHLHLIFQVGHCAIGMYYLINIRTSAYSTWQMRSRCVWVCVCTCVKGIVRTSVIVTGVQVCSRIFMVWFITNSIRQVSANMQTQD